MNDDRRQPPAEGDEKLVIPVVEEEVATGVRAIRTGAVRVDKHVEKRIRKIESPVIREQVEVRRVPMNRVVAQVPRVRKEGDALIIPVVEEQVTVTKRLVLKEEIHVIKHRKQDRWAQEVELAKENVEVCRLDSDGRVLGIPRRKLVRRR